MDEAQLIERAGRGEPAAFRSLYHAHADRVWAVVRRLAADDALAEDWAQEAWIHVFRALPSFRGDSRLSTWIHRFDGDAVDELGELRREPRGHDQALEIEVVRRGERLTLRLEP